MKQINISVPDHLSPVLEKLAKEAGQSLSSAAANVLQQGIVQEVANRERLKNYAQELDQ